MNLLTGLAFLIFLSIVFNIVKGRIRGRGMHIDRSVSPFAFWLVIALKCVVVLFVAFPKQGLGIVQYGIEDAGTETQRKVQEFQGKRKHDVQPTPHGHLEQ